MKLFILCVQLTVSPIACYGSNLASSMYDYCMYVGRVLVRVLRVQPREYYARLADGFGYALHPHGGDDGCS